jgi:transposase
MSWRQTGVRDQRVELVVRASHGESLSALCREYEITRPTAYLWLRRFREQGVAGVEERSQRPHVSPSQTRPEMEERIHERRKQATKRFQRERPNELWQMDFKGPKDSNVAIGPLSVLDDRRRYLVALQQTGTTRSEVVREHLEGIFHSDGLPEAMLMDHGVPWWSARAASGWTQLMVWLMKHGIRCSFSGTRHLQTGVPRTGLGPWGGRRRARWSDSMARWSGRAAGPMPASGWSRVGSTTSATSTAASAPSVGHANPGQSTAAQHTKVRSQPACLGLRGRPS